MAQARNRWSLLRSWLLSLCIGMWLSSALIAQQQSDAVVWESLPAIPNSIGVAGAFAGVVDGKLIVAGGANFPEAPPWEGGTKVWHDSIVAFDPTSESWSEVGKLPAPRGYGLSIIFDDALLMIGGSDSQRHFTDVWRLDWKDSKFVVKSLEPLPIALANHCGAAIGSRVFVIGGTTDLNSTEASSKVWMIDLASDRPEWKEQPSLPGPGRMLATAGAVADSLYLFGGVSLEADAEGKPVRTYLQDAYRFRTSSSWTRITDLPHPLAASPSPAPSIGPAHLLLVGGDDGSKVGFQPVAEHPGFNRQVLAYSTITDAWCVVSETPEPQVTVTSVPWEGGWAFPSGEVRPGVRTPAVKILRVEPRRTNFVTLDAIVLGIYLLSVVAVGCYFMFRNRTTDDYFRGGGRVPWWAAGISIFATMLSSITFMAIPAKAYQSNWTFYLANSYLILAPLIVAFYLPFFRRLNATTAYEYLELRFNLLTRRIASGLFILLQLGRLAVVVFLPALTLSTAADFDIRWCIALMGLLVVLYSVLGGVEGVIWTDVTQTVVLMGGAIWALIAIVTQIDGGLATAIRTANEHEKLFQAVPWSLDLTVDSVLVIVIGSVFANLFSYTASQDVVQRYVTTKDERSAARAIWTGFLMAPVAQLVFFAIGTALFVFYRQHPERVDMTRPIDGIFPQFIVDELPPGITGLVIAAIFAAAQSTLSSTLNSVSTAFVTDFYRPWFPGKSDLSYLQVARWATVIVGVAGTAVALLFTLYDVRSQWELFLMILSLFGGTIAGLFVLGMCSQRATSSGAILGALGSVGVVCWLKFGTPVHYFVYPVAGVLSCVGIGTIISRLLPADARDLTGLTWSTLRRASESDSKDA